MKFAAVLSYCLVALVAGAIADPQNNGRQGNGRGGFGGGNANAQGGNKGGNTNTGNANGNATAKNGNNNKNSGATSTSAAAAAAAASASTANTGNTGNNAGNNGNNAANNGNAQDSTTLDPSVIATGFALDGQQVPAAGQVASLTSTNNFINFCLTVNKPITNGQQVKTGSCNPAPMGVIAATTNMPSSKFVSPKNGDTIQANQAFTIQMAIQNIQTGNFVNAQSNYYSAPQQVNGQGDIIGHSHVVVEPLTALDQTTPTDPNTFAFFKGINGAAVNGVVTADVTNGLPAGVYRMASINAAANHQPVLVAVAQHGSLDDMVYFTVSGNGASASNSTGTGTGTGNANTGTGTGTGNANKGTGTGTGNANTGAASNSAASAAATTTGNNNTGNAGNAGNTGNTGKNANGGNTGKNANGGNTGKNTNTGKNGGRGRGRGRALRFAREMA